MLGLGVKSRVQLALGPASTAASVSVSAMSARRFGRERLGDDDLPRHEGKPVRRGDGGDGQCIGVPSDRTWLTTMTNEMLATLPKPVFSPSFIFDFDDVREAIAMVEESIVTKQERVYAERIEAAVKAAQDPNHSYVREPVFAPMAETLWKAALTFPLILRRAMLISISSHVEHVLRQWCALLHGEWSLPSKLGKAPARVSDVLHCMAYLRDVAGLAVADFEQWDEWKALDAYRAARNCLAHNGGIVDREDDRPKIAGLPHVHVETDGLLAVEPVIVLDAGACEAAADTAKKFFDRLTRICQQDPRAKRPSDAQ